jgi:opacity protein-like surface antigen
MDLIIKYDQMDLCSPVNLEEDSVMINSMSGFVLEGESSMGRKLLITAMTVMALCGFFKVSQADSLWTPSIGLIAVHDDNINFSEDGEVDDYIYVIEPGLKFDSTQELTQIAANGRIHIRRYQDYDDLNDEIYRFNLDGDSKFTERFNLRGKYNFIKDTTLDSELDETGRILFREDRISHEAKLIPRFNLTERTSISISGRYRSVTYDSNTDVDYSVWGVNLPVRWRLETLVDTVYISPGFSFRDSDENSSDTFSLRFGWDHETTERLNLSFSAGTRYTEYENKEDETQEDESQNAVVGALRLKYDLETGSLKVDLSRDLRNTAEGEQVNVTRVIVGCRWNFVERLGMELEGRYYYTQSEGADVDETTEYILVSPQIFYNLTEHHELFIAYEYSQENQKDVENEPRTERNRIWGGIRLNFPINL